MKKLEIFALLMGMYNDVVNMAVPQNFSIEISEVYTEAAKEGLEQVLVHPYSGHSIILNNQKVNATKCPSMDE